MNNNQVDLTELLSSFVVNLKFSSLPNEVVYQTKMFVADYCAASIASFKVNNDLNNAMLSVAEEEGGKAQASVLFSDKKFPVSTAAWLNAAYSHGADMDDGNRKAAGHIGTSVISAVFAAAEEVNSSWSEVITAINAGYEVFNRIVSASMPDIYNKGFHSTGVGGAMACAAAVAKIYNLDKSAVYNAISLAAIQSAGLIIIDESGQGCKPINPAAAAKTGVLSAKLAKRGIESSKNPLQSKKGWFNAFGDNVNEAEITDGLGEKFTILESYLKLFPTCRHTHCAMEAAETLRKQIVEQEIGFDEIKQIKLIVYPAAIKSTGSIRFPSSAEQAKFSICYCIATMLNKGNFGFEDLDCNISATIKSLIEKIVYIEDPSLENRQKGIRGAGLQIELLDNTALSHTVLVPKGEGEKTLSIEDICQKMNNCAAKVTDTEKAVDLVTQIININPNNKFSYPMRDLRAVR